jgi:hypothetical protein
MRSGDAMRYLMIRTGPVFLALCLLLAPVKVYAAETYNVDFNDVEIRKVIETVSEITGKNFLVDDRVQGKVTVIGPRSLTKGELYQVFLSILNVKGFAVVPSGKINKVVPSANIAGYGVQMKVGKSEGIAGIDAYVTQIIPVEYTEAADLKILLAPLIPKTDNITSYDPTNLLCLRPGPGVQGDPGDPEPAGQGSAGPEDSPWSAGPPGGIRRCKDHRGRENEYPYRHRGQSDPGPYRGSGEQAGCVHPPGSGKDPGVLSSER